MRTFRTALICGVLAASLAGFLWALDVFAPLTRNVFGSGIVEVPTPFWGEWAGILLLAFGLAWTTVEIHSRVLKMTVAAVALAEAALLAWVLYLCGVVWPPFAPLAAGGFAVIFGAIHGRSKPGRRKREIESAFGGRISCAMFRRLLDSNDPIPFAGEEREATVLVCRFFNRRELAQALAAPDFVALSNDFLQTGSQAVIEAGGTLTECGEGQFHAVFGAPLSVPDHAAQACRAGFALAHRLESFRREALERWNVEPDCRIAIHTGALIMGLCISSAGRDRAFAIAGEALDFCRWLCKANLTYGVRMLLGPQTFPLAREAVEARPADLLWIPDEPLREEIYEGLALAGKLSPEEAQRQEKFWIGVILFRSKRWKEAAEQFQAVLQEKADDALAQLYLERTAQRETDERWAFPNL